MIEYKLFYNSFLEFENFTKEKNLTPLEKVEYYKWCK